MTSLEVFALGCKGLKTSESKCDPYVQAGIGDEKYRTATVSSCNNPVFKDDAFCFRSIVPATDELSIEVYDEDTFSDDAIGKVALPLKLLENGTVTKVLSVINANGEDIGKVEVKLTCGGFPIVTKKKEKTIAVPVAVEKETPKEELGAELRDVLADRRETFPMPPRRTPIEAVELSESFDRHTLHGEWLHLHRHYAEQSKELFALKFGRFGVLSECSVRKKSLTVCAMQASDEEEEAILRTHIAARKIQCCWRGNLSRFKRRFLLLRRKYEFNLQHQLFSATKIQSVMRMCLVRKNFKKIGKEQ